VHGPREVPAVVRREGRTDDRQCAAEEPVVNPEAIHIRAGERSELDELHGGCVKRLARAAIREIGICDAAVLWK
jgi:hypothetical protein